MTAIKKLPQPKKKAVAKKLVEEGFSFREIELYVGADHSTIAKWAKEAMTDEEKIFAQQFYSLIETMKEVGLVKALNKIIEMTPKLKSVDEVIRVADFMQGTQTKSGQQNNIQVNFGDISKEVEKKYGRI